MTQPEARTIEKIEALLTKASREDTPEHERSLAQDMAERMLAKYNIDMAILNLGPKAVHREVIMWKIPSNYETSFDYAGDLNSMMARVYGHYNIIFKQRFDGFEMYGFEDDLRMAQATWTGVHLNFITRMLPTWSASRTFDHNVYVLKESGKSWMEIVNAAPEDAGLTKNSGSTLRNAYARWAEAIGAEPKAQPRQPKAWRAAFVAGYKDRLNNRLWEMKHERDEVIKKAELVDSRVGLALMTEKERIQATYWEKYPDEHPQARERRMAEFAAAEEAAWEALTPAQQRKETERQEKLQEKWRRQDERANRNRRYYDDAGIAAGRAAADSADLGGSKVGKSTQEALG